jgi:hypothetical protein
MKCLAFRSTRVRPQFQWDSCYSIFSFLCSALYIFGCRFVSFLLAIVLSVLRRLTGLITPSVSSTFLKAYDGITEQEKGVIFILFNLI